MKSSFLAILVALISLAIPAWSFPKLYDLGSFFSLAAGSPKDMDFTVGATGREISGGTSMLVFAVAPLDSPIQKDPKDEYIHHLEDSISRLQELLNQALATQDALRHQISFEGKQKDERYQALEARYQEVVENLSTLRSQHKALREIPFRTEKVHTFGNEFHVVIIENLRDTHLELFWLNPEGKPYGDIRNLFEGLEEEGKRLVFAANAGMFETHRQGSKPKGLYIEHGMEMRPLDTKVDGYGNFYMQPNGVFLIDSSQQARVVPTDSFSTYAPRVLFATQSGPMLVFNNQLNSNFNIGSSNLNIRNGVGVTERGEVIFIISQAPVNLYNFASLFRDHYHCPNALYLDGAISKTYLPALRRKDTGNNFGPMVGVWIPIPNPGNHENAE